jgi:DNA transposition AAA+ family ATPase
MKTATDTDPIETPDGSEALSDAPRFDTAALPIDGRGAPKRRMQIPGDQVNKATAELPDDQRSAIRRLHAHAYEGNLNLAEAGELIRYSGETVHKLFHGKYEGNLAAVAEEIERFFRLHDARSQSGRLGFIPTGMSRRIWQVCETALEFQRVAFVFGDTQIGKTEALIAYAKAHNHGQTIYVEVPTGGTLSNFLKALAKALRIDSKLTESILRERIFEAFDDRMLLIVDEAHAVFPEEGGHHRAMRTIKFIRQLHDARKCGVVISATNVFARHLDQAGELNGMLKQFQRRRVVSFKCPAVPAAADLAAFAAAYKLPAATGDALALQAEVIRDEALGMWLCLLRMAAKLAAKRKQALNWRHVRDAHTGLRALEKGEA